ncbi:MAG: MFS transporter [Chloroflexi bacterium]|nr:MFS transporter [Chloroflexota bacterium]
MKTRSAPISLLLISYVIFFMMAIPGGILNVAWTYMQVTFDVPFDALGILLLANTLGALIGTFFSGRLIARFGMGRYLLTGGVIMGVGLSGYILAPVWIVVVASAFVTMLGFSCFNAGLNNFVSLRYTTGQFTWLHAAYGLGQALGPTLATIIVERLGLSWHLGYGVVLVLGLLVTVTLAVTRRRWVMPEMARSADGEVVQRASVRETLFLPAVLLGMSLFFVSSGVIAGTGQLSTTLLSSRGIALAEAGFWVSAYWTSFTIGRILMGFIAHRFENRLLLRASLIGATIGTLLLWQNASTFVNLLGLLVIGFSCAPLYPTLVAESHRRVGDRYRLNALGFQMTASSLGQSLVPGAIAFIAAHTTIGIIGVFLVIGAVFALGLEEVAARRQEEVVAVGV